jgi:hypothetical protein
MQRISRIMSAAAAAALLVALLTGCLKLDPTAPEISQLPPGGKRVLFIGNSLTYTNSLPQTVAGLADASGDTIRVLQVALPNFAVIDHVLGLSNALDAIRSQPWNYVVIQQGPTTTQVNRDTLIIATKLIDPHVKAAGGRTAVLMPWPQMHQPHLFDAVRQSALLASQSVDGGVFLPAGEAWRVAREADPLIALYGSDGYHPGPLGTYLAALVIYERVTGKDARQLPGTATVARVPLTLPEATVRFLQQVAHETVSRFP